MNDMDEEDLIQCPHDETDGEGTCLDCGKFLSWRDTKEDETPPNSAGTEHV